MKFIKHTNVACAAIALALVSSASVAEREKESSKVDACDRAWAHLAAVSDKEEITLAKAAESKAESQEVKQHAQQMIQDHSKTTAELKKWAEANDVELKAEIPPMKEAALREIESKAGAEFDKAYMNHEVEGHRHAAVHFQNGVEFVKNSGLKQFAQENQPTINQHLAMVEQQTHAQRTGLDSLATQNGNGAGQQQGQQGQQSGNSGSNAAGQNQNQGRAASEVKAQ